MIKGRSGGEGIDSEPPHHAGSTQNMLMNHAAARPHRGRGGGSDVREERFNQDKDDSVAV